MPLRRFLAGLLLSLVWASSAPAQLETPLVDLVEVEVLGRNLVALGAGRGDVRERLHLGERVLWYDSRGALAVVITDQRVLAASTVSEAWQQARYERGEVPPARAELGERVALVTTDRRALGFNASSGTLLQYRLGPREALRGVDVGEQVGVVVTSRNALGLSPFRDRFQQQDLQVQERIETVAARSALATVRTSRRLLVFRSDPGSWSERRREIHER